MKIIFRFAALIIIVALGFWLWMIFFPSPEKVIRARLAELARTATITENEKPIARALKAQKVVNFFSPTAEIIFEVPGIGQHTFSGREEIAESAKAGFLSIPSIAVDFLDVNIQLTPGKQSADVDLTAKVRAGGSKDFGVQEMRFVLKKIEGRWLIVRVETVKTLS